MSAKPVSIILLAHNRWPLTLRCLRSLRRHTDPRLYELLVYDNASSDGTRASLRRLKSGWPELRVTRNRRNLPFAAAVNRGMRRAGGRDFVWLNNDTVLSRGWLEGLLAAAGSDGAVAAVGPMTDNMAPPLQRPAASAKRASPGPGRAGSGLEDTPLLGGFCLLLKRAAVDRVGLLDERFVWGWEDVDYCLRLRHAGYRLVLARGVFVGHAGSATITRMVPAERHRLDLANRALIRRKWADGGPWQDDMKDFLGRAAAPWLPPALSASVVVACGGAAAGVRACLDSLRRGAAPLSHEVLAVDRGESARTSALLHRLARRRPELRVLGPWGPSSPAEALNRAVAAAQGDFLAFLDDTARAGPGWLRRLLDAATARNEASVVTPADPALHDFLFLRRRSFSRVGGFDERFAGSLCAEDLVLRLAQLGHARVTASGTGLRRAARARGPEPARDRERLAARSVVPASRLPPAASIVVVCRGSWAAAKRCLDSVRRCSAKTPYEVLAVVGGASLEAGPGLEALARGWPQLRVLADGDDLPYPGTLNRALRSARGDHFVILSDDARPAPGWLEGLVETARSDGAAGVVTPGRRGADACLLVPREVFLSVGEFDDRYLGGLWAADFRLRAKQRGFHLLAARGARVGLARRPRPDAGRREASGRDWALTFDKWAGHPFLPVTTRR